MEARQAYPGRPISKSLVAVTLVSIAIGLGVMAASVASDIKSGAGATTTQTQSAGTRPAHFLPATNLRQDNDYPVLPSAKAQRALHIRPS